MRPRLPPSFILAPSWNESASQGADGVYSGGAPGGYEAGGQRGDGHGGESQSERQRIARVYVVEQVSHKAGEEERRGGAENDSTRRQREAIRQDELQDRKS